MIDLLRFICRKNNYEKVKLGKITKRLCLDFIYSGDGKGWKWKRQFFSDFSIDMRVSINPHITIVGKSGSGKSNACKLIMKALNLSGITTIVFDAHNEYVRIANDISADVYDATYTGINIFALDGMSVKERTSELADTFKRIFRLGEVQSYTLYKCIRYAYKIAMFEGREPRLGDLFFAINVFKKHAQRTEMGTLESIEKRLIVLNGASFSSNIEFDRIIGKSCIFALSGLHTNEAQKLYIEGFLKRFYTKMLQLEKRDSVKFYIVIDEAEKLEDGSMIGRIIAEGRKYGVGVMTISQRAKVLESSVRGNASVNIIFYQREPDELNYLANLVAGGNELNRFTEVKKAIRNLSQGNAVVVCGTRNPEVVKFDLYEIAKEYLGEYISKFAVPGISKADLFGKMRSLGFCDDDIANGLERLIVDNVVKAHSFEHESGSEWYITMPRNSAEHDIMLGRISRKLSSDGIRNSIYNSSYGPDIVAFYDGEKVAIEYETGMKKVEDTLAMLSSRSRYYKQIAVIVNDKHFDRYSKAGVECLKASDFFRNGFAKA